MDPFKPYEPKPARPKAGKVDAEEVALKALAWIMADDDMVGRFVGLTGAGPDEIRARIKQPDFLGAVLDFILGDEPTLMDFVQAEGLAPEVPMLARAKLP